MSLNTEGNWLLYGSVLTPYDTNDLTLRTSTQGKLIFDTSNTNITGNIDVSGSVNFKNSEGIIFDSSSAPSTTTNTLYRVGSDIYWNGSALGSNVDTSTLDNSMSSVETRMTSAETNITNNKSAADASFVDHLSKITTNTSNISTNATAISTNKSAADASFVDILSSINTNASNISTNASAISTNKSAADASFVDHLSSINTNASNISTNTTAISTNKSAADASFVDLESRKLNLAGGTMTGNIDMGSNKITSSYTPSSNTDLANKSYVDGKISALVDGAPAMLDTLKELSDAVLDTSNVDIVNILDRIGVVDTSVNSLTSSVSTNASNISTNTSSISTNASNISTNASAISSNKSAADASFVDHLSSINTNASNISTNSTAISTNKSAADASLVYIQNNYATNNAPTITGGMNVTGNVSLTGNIVPSADITYDLGTSDKRFKDLYLSGSTIVLGGTTLSSSNDGGSLSVGDTNGNTKNVLYKEVFDPSYEYALSSISTNASAISSNKSAADASFVDHLSSINTNASNISTNASAISSNKSAADASFVDHLSSINTNASNISTNASAISSNKSAADASFVDHLSSINTNASNISTNTSNISTNATAISSNKSAADASFVDHLSSINTNASNISTNATAISNNKSAADASFVDHLSSINTNASNISTNASAISSNKSAADASFVDLETRKLNLAGGTMTGNIDMGSNKITSSYTPSLTTDLTNKSYVDSKISALVDGAPAMLDTLKELSDAVLDTSNVDIVNILDRIGVVDTSVNSLTSSVSTNASNISTNSTAISSNKSAADASFVDHLSSINTNASNISTNASAISSNKSAADASFVDHLSSINTNASNISTNSSAISSNKSAADASFVDHLSSINTNTSNISTNASAISSNKSAADASFVDLETRKLNLSGGTMTGALTISGDVYKGELNNDTNGFKISTYHASIGSDTKLIMGQNNINAYRPIYSSEDILINDASKGLIFGGSVTDTDKKLNYDGSSLKFGSLNISNFDNRITTNTTAISTNKSAADASLVYIQNNYATNSAPTITGGMSITGDVNLTGDIIPSTDVTYDLGSSSKRFKDLYLSGNTIVLGDTTISSSGDGTSLSVGDTSGNTKNVLYKEVFDPSYDYTVSKIDDISNNLFTDGYYNNFDMSFIIQSGNNGYVAGALKINNFYYSVNHPDLQDAEYVFEPTFYDFSNNILTTYSGIITSSGVSTTIDLTKPIKFVDIPYGDTLTVLATSIGQTGNTYNATFSGGSTINLRYKTENGVITEIDKKIDNALSQSLPLIFDGDRFIELMEKNMFITLDYLTSNSRSNSLSILGRGGLKEYEYLNFSPYNYRFRPDGTSVGNFIISGMDENYSGDVYFKLAKKGRYTHTDSSLYPYEPTTRLLLDSEGETKFYDHNSNEIVKFSSTTDNVRLSLKPTQWTTNSEMIIGDYSNLHGREIAFSYNDGINYKTDGGQHNFSTNTTGATRLAVISSNVVSSSIVLESSGGLCSYICRGKTFLTNDGSDTIEVPTNRTMFVRTRLYVGGGTYNANAPLQVNGNGGGTSHLNDHAVYTSINNNSPYSYYETGDNHNASITATHDILTYGVLRAVSDRRIKTNITDASNSLALMRKIPLKSYNYLDPLVKGTLNVRGWIAQEVRQHLPSAVKLSTDFIPNVMLVGEISNNILTTTQPFDVSNTTIKVMDASENNIIIELGTKHNVPSGSKYEFTFKEEDKEFNGPCFVYGEEVDDFHTIDKSQVSTLLYGAVSELDETLNREVTLLKNSVDKVSVSTSSDTRSVKDVQVIQDASALEIVKNVEPKKYKYVDTSKGENVEYGFVAQDVQAIFPEAVELTSHPVPSVLADVEISGNIITFATSVNLDLGYKVLINNLTNFDYNGEPLMIERKINDQKYQLNRTLTDTTGFCYGRYVDNFAKLSKDKLMPILWSGTQELIRENADMKNRLATLEQQVAQLLANQSS